MMTTIRSSLIHTNPRTAIFLIPINTKQHLSYPRSTFSSPVSSTLKATESLPGQKVTKHPSKIKPLSSSELLETKSRDEFPKVASHLVLLGAVTVGVALIVMGFDDDHKALAFGPEGPLVEEFWENMRRYALYALTVSTGFAYTVFQPILELLRNPVSAVLVLAIFGGSIYIVTQVLSAMVGVSDFSYDYSY
ncbi:uncharacterized protein LOC113782781 [Coffea eugenioides]|uniref:uncharacterized protein LOC113782781 n=1 Tax=Coffea eugenioides TaxID=49369 RepID=UPI000F609683|nr:uncharacterized protein LOC113782781 [Coffea eugenioides]